MGPSPRVPSPQPPKWPKSSETPAASLRGASQSNAAWLAEPRLTSKITGHTLGIFLVLDSLVEVRFSFPSCGRSRSKQPSCMHRGCGHQGPRKLDGTLPWTELCSGLSQG